MNINDFKRELNFRCAANYGYEYFHDMFLYCTDIKGMRRSDAINLINYFVNKENSQGCFVQEKDLIYHESEDFWVDGILEWWPGGVGK